MARKQSVKRLAGIIPKPNKPVSIQEMEAACYEPLQEELTKAFAAADETYDPLAADDVIARNTRRDT